MDLDKSACGDGRKWSWSGDLEVPILPVDFHHDLPLHLLSWFRYEVGLVSLHKSAREGKGGGVESRDLGRSDLSLCSHHGLYEPHQ